MSKEKESTKVVINLHPDVYKAIEAKFRKPSVSNTTSEIEAGYLLGVQDVLRLLREGYTVGM